LLGEIKFVVLKGKSFTCLSTAKLKIPDIKNYIAPGFDYAKFIRAYEVEQHKFTGHTSGSKISSQLYHHTRSFTAP